VLQKTEVPMWSNEECVQKYRDANYIVPNTSFVCAGGMRNKASAKGDSGSPLMFYETKRHKWMAIGIVSAGARCGRNIPGLYTRISSYMPWIHSNL